MTRALVILFTLASTAVAAEPVVHSPPAFPSHIREVHAAPIGAYLLTGSNEVWFVDGNTARRVPIPLDGQIQSLRIEPTGGLAWGCTHDTVFATDAGGAWQSWGLGDATTRQRCHVVPSPGGTAWVLANSADESGPYLEVGIARGQELSVSMRRIDGVHLERVASDAAGGVWALAFYPRRGLLHFDGANWRIWTDDPLQWAGSALRDAFPIDRTIYAEALATDGVGGLVAASTAELTFVRSTSPYPPIDRVRVNAPGFELGSGTVAVGPDRVWGLGHKRVVFIIASWDFSGTLVFADAVDAPKFFDPRDVNHVQTVSVGPQAVWFAAGGVLARRDGAGWEFFAAESTIDALRRGRWRERTSTLQAVPWILNGAVITVVGPATWHGSLGVPYSRALAETMLGWTAATFTQWPILQNDPWRGTGRSTLLLAFGLVFGTGAATIATVIPEALVSSKGDAFPIGGALLGGASGYVAGALIDVVLELAGVSSEFGRAALWSSFTAVGAPLGFHLMRGPRGAD